MRCHRFPFMQRAARWGGRVLNTAIGAQPIGSEECPPAEVVREASFNRESGRYRCQFNVPSSHGVRKANRLHWIVSQIRSRPQTIFFFKLLVAPPPFVWSTGRVASFLSSLLVFGVPDLPLDPVVLCAAGRLSPPARRLNGQRAPVSHPENYEPVPLPLSLAPAAVPSFPLSLRDDGLDGLLLLNNEK